MTAVATAPASRVRSWWAEHLTGDRIEVNGSPIHARAVQMICWGAILGACGAAVVAGAYFNMLEVNWHVFWLKHWWDGGMGGLVTSPSWDLYRHGLRDIMEPVIALMVVATVMAKPRWWEVRVSTARLLLTPPLLLAGATGLILGAVWLQYFGLPAAWAWLHTASHGAWPSRWNPGGYWPHLWAVAETVAFGFIVHTVCKRFWAPVGATFQGYIADRLAERAYDRPFLPLWIRMPLAPPVGRERVSLALNSGHAARSLAARRRRAEQRTSGQTVLHAAVATGCALLALVVLYLMVTGFIAHFWIGSGYSFPFLAP